MTTTLTQRTDAEIAELKQQWCNDPCWDIEFTEGFEAHESELAEYSRRMHQQWDDVARQTLQAKADKLGISDNLDLARYLQRLETRIERLENQP